MRGVLLLGTGHKASEEAGKGRTSRRAGVTGSQISDVAVALTGVHLGTGGYSYCSPGGVACAPLGVFWGGYEAGSCSEQGLPAPVMPLLVSEAEGSGSPSVLASPQSPHPISSLQLCAS